jgi:hypothetical protein
MDTRAMKKPRKINPRAQKIKYKPLPNNTQLALLQQTLPNTNPLIIDDNPRRGEVNIRPVREFIDKKKKEIHVGHHDTGHNTKNYRKLFKPKFRLKYIPIEPQHILMQSRDDFAYGEHDVLKELA